MYTLLLPLLFLFGYFAPSPAPIELKGYFNCRSSLVEETGDGMTCYARTQRDCRNGTVVLAFEKRRHRNLRNGFEIVDTVHVQAAEPHRAVEITRCTAAGQSRQYFVLFDAALSGAHPYLSHLMRVWGVNAQNRLVSVPAKTLQCLNEDYEGN